MPPLISRVDNDDESTITATSSYDYKTDLPGIRPPEELLHKRNLPIPEVITTFRQGNVNNCDCDDDDDDDSIISFNDYTTPALRLRGGDGRSLTENMENEDEVVTRFRLDHLDEIESEPVGGTMDSPKLPGMIRISGCNPNGIKSNQVKSHLQHAIDLEIDIQCYSEVNQDFLKTQQRQSYQEDTNIMDRKSRSVWGLSQVIVENDFKPGGTAIISMGKTAGRVKKSGIDKMGRWTYQLLDGKGNKDILIVSA